jgi:hypothetical protein
MKKLFFAALVLVALVIGSVMPVAAEDTATGTIVKVRVIGPGGNLLTIGSQETGEITVNPGDTLIIMGMAKKDGKGALNFNLFDAATEPWQNVAITLFQEKAKKQTRVIHYKFTPEQETGESLHPFYFNVTSESGAELDWARIDILVASPAP